MRQLRTERNGTAIWKMLGHTNLNECPECQQHSGLSYLGLAKNYTPGLQAKIYQCKSCGTWVDVVSEKYRSRNVDKVSSTK